jgi:predicted ATPase
VRQTNWCVITGAPCSGKTAVIDELERRGFHVIHEVARAYIDEQLADGWQLHQIKADELQFERHILNEKVRIEASLSANETVFFDRGLPDSIAYFKLSGIDSTEPLKKSGCHRYKQVFFFERFGFSKDQVRSEDEATADKLDFLIYESYRMLGYDLVPIPKLPIPKRADFILTHL